MRSHVQSHTYTFNTCAHNQNIIKTNTLISIRLLTHFCANRESVLRKWKGPIRVIRGV